MEPKELFLQAQSRFYDVYSALRERSSHTQLPLHKFPLRQPDIVGGPWMIFYIHAEDYIRETRNAVELFGMNVLRLDAWREVLHEYPRDSWPWLLEEAVLPLATSASLAPYAIRERLIYCATFLLHYSKPLVSPGAPRIIDEHKIGWSLLFESPKGLWTIADQLQVNLKDFRDALDCIKSMPHIGTMPLNEFRNRLTHRLPPNVEYGLATTLVRVQRGEHVGFGGGGEAPIETDSLVPALWTAHEHCTRAFRRFYEIVGRLIDVWEARCLADK